LNAFPGVASQVRPCASHRYGWGPAIVEDCPHAPVERHPTRSVPTGSGLRSVRPSGSVSNMSTHGVASNRYVQVSRSTLSVAPGRGFPLTEVSTFPLPLMVVRFGGSELLLML
jgi:hypothetical protein